MNYPTKTNTLILLVHSLSKAEKRLFSLQAQLHDGDKVYLHLLELIEENKSAEDVYVAFTRNYPDKSYETAAKYLYKILMDCLLRQREKQDIQTETFNHISKAGILFERELFDEAFTELDKAKKLAIEFENDSLQILIQRTELKYLSSLDFKGISERELVAGQMKLNEIMKYSRSLNQHTQLYDILKYRLMHKGYARSDKQKENLNDLVLSELHLIANSSYRGFEAEKLHLLFQATYYLNSGNYKSAIRLYKELLSIFEENRRLILNPPVYYLSAIQGILDSLHIAELYDEMPFFITKLKEIEQGHYSVEFALKVKAIIFHYESIPLANHGLSQEINTLQENYEDTLFRKSHLLRPDEQLRLYLNIVTLSLATGELRQAQKSMKKILASGKLFHKFPLFRTARLINLLIQAEQGNHAFIPGEIASIRRSHQSEKPIFYTEKLIFWYAQACPLPFYKPFRQKLLKQFHEKKKLVLTNKYERQLLKTFDFLDWIEKRLTKNNN